MSGRAPLRFSDVCFAYEREEVLHNVDLSVPDKSLVAVVGPNGGGKTTFLRLALGLLKPQRGTVHIFGDVPEHRRRSIGYVAQHLSFDPAFPVSVLDVVLMGRAERHWLGPYRRDDHAKALEALERVQLAHLSRRPLAHLSGGERQRALIAHAGARHRTSVPVGGGSGAPVVPAPAPRALLHGRHVDTDPASGAPHAP